MSDPHHWHVVVDGIVIASCVSARIAAHLRDTVKPVHYAWVVYRVGRFRVQFENGEDSDRMRVVVNERAEEKRRKFVARLPELSEQGGVAHLIESPPATADRGR